MAAFSEDTQLIPIPGEFLDYPFQPSPSGWKILPKKYRIDENIKWSDTSIRDYESYIYAIAQEQIPHITLFESETFINTFSIIMLLDFLLPKM